MPSLEENIKAWGNAQRWTGDLEDGDKWSRAWGSAEMQWYGSILPRIHKYISTPSQVLHVGSILEIAPGYGRWTQYLQALCKKLIVVDLNSNCIEACQEKFSSLSHIEYHVNDGKSLEMIEDQSIYFLFSYDSFVHMEINVVDSYLSEITRKLKPNGIGFIHHSNLGEYLGEVDSGDVQSHWRAKTVTAKAFKQSASTHSLACLSQELFNWGNEKGKNTDCFSIITPEGSKWTKRNQYQLIESDFMIEVSYLKNLSQVYSAT